MDKATLHIDDLLSESYAGFEPAVPAFAWEQISGKLEGGKKRRAFIWWQAAAIVAVITGISMWIYLSRSGSSEQELPAIGKTENTSGKDLTTGGKTGASDSRAPFSGQSSKEQPAAQGQNNSVSAHAEAKYAKPEINRTGTKQEAAEKQEVAEAENAYRSGSDMLSPFGIRYEETENPWNKLETTAEKPAMHFPAPVLSVSNRWLIGLGAGQVLSSTGFTVNPGYGNYVHKNFTRRMQEGEGLLSSLSFSGMVSYRVAGNHYIYTGAEYFQRRNSLNFDFTDEAPALNSVGNVQKDAFGNYPIKGYIQGGSGIEVKFRGSNTYTALEIPVGWMMEVPMGRKFTFIPSAGAGLGIIGINSSNTTLNYQLLEVEQVNRAWFRKSYALLNTSAGVYKNIGNRIKWGISANAGYTLSQMYISDSPVRPRAFTGGLSTRFIWRLD